MAVDTTAKSRNIDPPNTAIPAKIGISAIPLLSPKRASDKPMIIAIATLGILLRVRYLETQKEKSIITPTKRKASMSPFLSMIFLTISILCFFR
jgi:hypothetical protein